VRLWWCGFRGLAHSQTPERCHKIYSLMVIRGGGGGGEGGGGGGGGRERGTKNL